MFDVVKTDDTKKCFHISSINTTTQPVRQPAQEDIVTFQKLKEQNFGILPPLALMSAEQAACIHVWAGQCECKLPFRSSELLCIVPFHSLANTDCKTGPPASHTRSSCTAACRS